MFKVNSKMTFENWLHAFLTIKKQSMVGRLSINVLVTCCSLHCSIFFARPLFHDFLFQFHLSENVSHASVVVDADRNETFLPFSIPLSFRSPSPLVSLQAVKER